MGTDSRQHILVFGATGGTGAAFVDQALARNHRVTAFVRNSSKLSEHDNLTLIEGDLFDSGAVRAACKIARADVAAHALRCIEEAVHVGEAVQMSW